MTSRYIFGLELKGGQGLSQTHKTKLEEFGRMEMEARGNLLLLWWNNKYNFLRALVNLGQFPARLVVPSSLNFQFKKEAVSTIQRKAGITTGNIPTRRVFLTEEQICSFHWKSENLYRDGSEEKSLSRHLTSFIKTVRLVNVRMDNI